MALRVGLALGAVRSGSGVDRVLGIPVLLVGSGMVVYIVWACLCIIG